MKEYSLDTPLTKEFFAYLKQFGRVTFMDMGGGYYTFEKPDWFSMKGFAGDMTVEVRFKPETMEITTDFLYSLFLSFKDGVCADIAGLKDKEKRREEKIRKLLG